MNTEDNRPKNLEKIKLMRDAREKFAENMESVFEETSKSSQALVLAFKNFFDARPEDNARLNKYSDQINSDFPLDFGYVLANCFEEIEEARTTGKEALAEALQRKVADAIIKGEELLGSKREVPNISQSFDDLEESLEREFAAAEETLPITAPPPQVLLAPPAKKAQEPPSYYLTDEQKNRIRVNLAGSIKSWHPDAKESSGGRYLILSPFRDDKTKRSFVIFPNGSAQDFATHEHFDTIDIYAEVNGMSIGEALRELGQKYGFAPISKPAVVRKPSPNPLPDVFPLPNDDFFANKELGKYGALHTYYNIENKIIGYVARYDTPEGKEFRPFTLVVDPNGRFSWTKTAKGWNQVAPIYGIEQLSKRPDTPILIVEGEKTAAAASMLFPEHIVLTWQGGVGNAAKADWSQLVGRNVAFIWPDADQKRDKKSGELLPSHQQPGMKAALQISMALGLVGCKPKIVIPPDGVDDGWDLADALEQDWTQEQAQTHAKVRAVDPQTLLPEAESSLGETKQAGQSSFRRVSASPLEIADKVWAFLEENAKDSDLEPFREVLDRSRGSAQLLAATLRTINQYQFIKELTLVEALMHRGFSNAIVPNPKSKKRDDDDPMALADIVSSIEDANSKTLRWNSVLHRLEGNGEPLNEQAVNQMVGICREKQRKYGKELGIKSIVLDAMHSSQVPAYHPVKEYLQEAKSTFLADPGENPFTEIFHRTQFKNDEDRSWFLLCLRAWLIGAVCRVYNGFQNPCLTFIGHQGIGKGTFASALAKNFKDYFASRRLYNITKDDEIALGEIFVWDIDEIDSTIGSVDIGALKSFITKPKVTVRRPYERTTSRIDPIASFIGSTNQDYFLQDQTGNRRFFSVSVKSFDFNWFRENFNPDSLWGWAMVEAEKVNFRPKIDEAFKIEQAARNESHRIQDPIELMIEKLIEPDPHGQISNNQLTTLLMRLNNPIAQNMVKGRGWSKTLNAIQKLGGEIYRTGKARGFKGVRIAQHWDTAE